MGRGGSDGYYRRGRIVSGQIWCGEVEAGLWGWRLEVP
jgi:hypothetical protein